MNDIDIHFKLMDGANNNAYTDKKNWCQEVAKSKDYIVAYWMTSWVKDNQWEVMTANAIAYRINKKGF